MKATLITGAVLASAAILLAVVFVALLGSENGTDERGIPDAVVLQAPERTPIPAATQFSVVTLKPRPTPSPTLAPTPTPTSVPTPAPVATNEPEPPRAPAAVPITLPPTPPPPPGQARQDIVGELYVLLNEQRAANGVGPVSRHGALAGAAQGYAEFHVTQADMYALSHNLDGSPTDRAARQGYCCGVGEIIVTSAGSAASMVDLWMNSPGHRAIILDPQYVSLGVGCYSAPYNGIEATLCVGVFGPY